MNGKREIRPRLLVEAVTICINYADYLRGVLDNRHHLDRWIILTVNSDTETQRLCEEFGLECRIASCLAADGSDFHAAFNKGQVLNEGLDLVSESAWALILDADVLLPSAFRSRVESLPLEEGVLYAACGRKFCDSAEALEATRRCEPWERHVAKYSQALGFFNLFHVGSAPNRYPARSPVDRPEHDDWLFTTSFAEARRRNLPFALLHVGPHTANWAGRASPAFGGQQSNGAEAHAKPPDIAQLVGRSRATLTAAVLGYLPNGRWRTLTDSFAKVFLIDEYQIHHGSGHPLVDADRRALARLLAADTDGADNLEFLGVHSEANLSCVPDGSLDALYLSGEPSLSSLGRILHEWCRKLKPGAIICGELCGHPHWPETTYAISSLLGTPSTFPHGFWWKRHEREECRGIDAGDTNGTGTGLAFLNWGREQLESLSMAVHAARRYWTGPIVLFHCGADEPFLHILCARLCIELLHVHLSEGYTELLEDVRANPPFPTTLCLRPGQLLAAEIRGGEPCAPSGTLTDSMTLPFWTFRQDSESDIARVANCSLASHYRPSEKPPIICFTEPPELWNDDAWEYWTHQHVETAIRERADVRVAPGTELAAVISKEAAPDFQRNFLTWKYSEDNRILLILVGIEPSELWLPGAGANAHIISVPSDSAAMILPIISNWSKSGTVTLLPEDAVALPGADIDPFATLRPPVAFRSSKFVEVLNATGNLFVPTCPAGIFEVEWLQAQLALQSLSPDATFSELVYQQPTIIEHTGIQDWGWRSSPTYRFKSDSGRTSSASPDAIVREVGHLRHLADDVVVISLPERTDRRDRIQEMMARERVKFRFVDGVRVKYEELNTFEVSEVELLPFKITGGRERFLCGTAGCRRAHLRCLEHAMGAGMKSLLIIEDDMHFEPGWYERYLAALAELPGNWLQLYLSTSNYRAALPFSKNLCRLQGSYQTTAILYSYAGIEAALRCIQHSRCEIDVWMGNNMHPFGCSYGIEPRIVYQNGGQSDIFNFKRGITP